MLVWSALLVLAAGLTAGVTGGPLWLDETLSVEIATLPLSQLPAALRVDGAPPLYYALLHLWTAAFGSGTTAVRLLTVALVPPALWLVWVLGQRLGGTAAARAGLICFAVLPWTMRFGSETRMYLLVVVLVLAGALALLRVREAASRSRVLVLALAVVGLLLTHYWSLFLLAPVGLWHLPGALRRSAPSLRVVAGLVGGGVLFTPWLPTFLFQAAHTGAPWALSPDLLALLLIPTSWGGGAFPGRVVLAVLLVGLAVAGALRLPAARALALVGAATLLLAFAQTALLGGAFIGRYTAVAVPLVALAAGLGAATLTGRRPLVALGALIAVGAVTGIPATAVPRTSALPIAEAVRAAAAPGAVVAYCPDQLAPAVNRLLGPAYTQVVYPTLGPPQRIDWVDYQARQDATDPTEVAARLDAMAGGRELLVLTARGYRTFGTQCGDLVTALQALRGPSTTVYATGGGAPQVLRVFR